MVALNNEIHKALVHSYVNSSPLVGLAYVLITTVHCKPVESKGQCMAPCSIMPKALETCNWKHSNDVINFVSSYHGNDLIGRK